MKTQIARFSPHQNGKVFALLTLINVIIFAVPFGLLYSMFAPAEAAKPPIVAFILVPLFYMVFSYVAVAIACLIYNLVSRWVGGIEYEAREAPAA